MNVINYHPWTMIYLDLPPSIGLVGHWNQWSNNETNLIHQAKKTNPNQEFTLLNFILPKMSSPIVGAEGVKSLARRYKVNQVINYGVPSSSKSSPKHQFSNNFEPLKNMLHLHKILILQNHPLIKFLQEIYPPHQIVIIETNKSSGFLDQLKKDLLNGDLDNYRQLVGANYSFTGTVGHGQKNGRKIGYPTANVLTNPSLPIRAGVYLVKVTLPNETRSRWGLSDYRETKNHQWIFETFILDFDKEIYDWVIAIELVAFHRQNIKTESLDQVKNLIQKDEVTLRKVIQKYEER